MGFLNFPRKRVIRNYPSRWLNYKHVNFKTLCGTQLNSKSWFRHCFGSHYRIDISRKFRRIAGATVLNHVFKDWRPLRIIIKICRGHCSLSEWSDLHPHVQAKKIMARNVLLLNLTKVGHWAQWGDRNFGRLEDFYFNYHKLLYYY